MKIEIKKRHHSFGGETQFASHFSETIGLNMNFSYHLPCSASEVENCIVFLSGLTCTEENFISKSGVQKYLKGTKTMVLCPDTSPRNLNIEGVKDSYDFGEAASFYVNATQAPYEKHYQMYDYIVNDIHQLVKDHFGVNKIGISGHSMGGHGALIIGLRNPDKFSSLSAFSPIVNPSECPWGQKALSGYLGNDQKTWNNYDACKLVENNNIFPKKILIDQGTNDQFLEKELLTENFIKLCDKKNQSCEVRMQKDYDHSYYFISTFIEDHIKHHHN